jgi:upstream activation factor subunit UAF30
MPSSKSSAKTATKAAAKTATKTATKSAKQASKAKATTKAAAKSKATTKVAAPPQNTVVAAAPEVTVDPFATTLETINAKFVAAHQRYQQLSAAISASRAELRILEKDVVRELKASHKAATRNKRKQGNRTPSGFVKPTAISDELAKFLGKDTGTEMARTEVTRELNAYIRQHNLQDKDNGRKINANASLRSLLQLGKNDELTYFNLQKYMSPHFAKSKTSASASS